MILNIIYYFQTHKSHLLEYMFQNWIVYTAATKDIFLCEGYTKVYLSLCWFQLAIFEAKIAAVTTFCFRSVPCQIPALITLFLPNSTIQSTCLLERSCFGSNIILPPQPSIFEKQSRHNGTAALVHTSRHQDCLY